MFSSLSRCTVKTGLLCCLPSASSQGEGKSICDSQLPVAVTKELRETEGGRALLAHGLEALSPCLDGIITFMSMRR